VKTFLRRWLLASAGFLCLELSLRPPRRDVLSDRAAELLIDLADLDMELRGLTPEVLVPPRPLCLSACCHGRRS
jgi:hypothetical protein